LRNFLDIIFNRKNRSQSNDNCDFLGSSDTTSDTKENLGDLTSEEVFPHLIISNFTSTIENDEKMWVTTSMLTRFLESFTDDLVILRKGEIIGTIGWREILIPLVDNPTSSFFFNTTADEHTNRDIFAVFPDTKMKKFLPEMYKRQRESAILQTYDNTFSSISSRSILEIGLQLDPGIKVSDLPQRKITNFAHNETVETIIRLMTRNDSSVLTLENTSSFLSAQIILERIVNDFKYLKQIDNFLDLPISDFKLKNAKMISPNTSIVEICKIMLNMRHPFVMTHDQLLTPKDVLGVLANYMISKNKHRA